MLRKWIGVTTLTILGSMLVGCGGKYDVVPVKGKLTFDGQPVPAMIVRFVPKEGRASESITNPDGTFEMSYTMDQMGVEVDSHEVMIFWSPPTDDGSVPPTGIQQSVLDDIKKNGPVPAKIETAQSNFEIKLPR